MIGTNYLKVWHSKFVCFARVCRRNKPEVKSVVWNCVSQYETLYSKAGNSRQYGAHSILFFGENDIAKRNFWVRTPSAPPAERHKIIS